MNDRDQGVSGAVLAISYDALFLLSSDTGLIPRSFVDVRCGGLRPLIGVNCYSWFLPSRVSRFHQQPLRKVLLQK